MILQDKLDYLIKKYMPNENLCGKISDDAKTVNIDGHTYNLFSHRFERRIIELRNLIHDGSLTDISVIRTNHMEEKGSSLEEIIAQEMDICRFLTDCEITSICAFENKGYTANIIVELSNGVIATIEASVMLPFGKSIDKHEITSRRGVACDRAVDTQVPQSSIYVFRNGNENRDENFNENCCEEFKDVDFELYGLDEKQCAAVRAAFYLVCNNSLRETFSENEKVMLNLLDTYRKSAISGEKVAL